MKKSFLLIYVLMMTFVLSAQAQTSPETKKDVADKRGNHLLLSRGLRRRGRNAAAPSVLYHPQIQRCRRRALPGILVR